MRYNEYMDKPKYVYQYQPCEKDRLISLENRQIWFSKPSHFNDPYDCTIRIDKKEWSGDELRKIYECFRSESGNPTASDKKCLQKGQLTEEFKEKVRETLNKLFDLRIKVMQNERGVSCFTEKFDDPLMWAHYAERHRGFCLEFNTDFDPFLHKLRQVNYSKVVPYISPVSLVCWSDKDQLEFLLAMITTKADCWSYEREWRLFHMEGDKAYGYDAHCLTGVYFGVNMDAERKESIAKILSGSETKLYEVHRFESEFKFVIDNYC